MAVRTSLASPWHPSGRHAVFWPHHDCLALYCCGLIYMSIALYYQQKRNVETNSRSCVRSQGKNCHMVRGPARMDLDSCFIGVRLPLPCHLYKQICPGRCYQCAYLHMPWAWAQHCCGAGRNARSWLYCVLRRRSLYLCAFEC